jgi:hypothetical protein
MEELEISIELEKTISSSVLELLDDLWRLRTLILVAVHEIPLPSSEIAFFLLILQAHPSNPFFQGIEYELISHCKKNGVKPLFEGLQSYSRTDSVSHEYLSLQIW